MTQSKRAKLAAALANKEYRHEYVAAHIGTGISFQVRANRIDRGWTQTELGNRASGMLQSQISKLEGPEHDMPNLQTLLKLAKALDVALMVRFIPFSELVNWVAGLGYSSPLVLGFDADTELNRDFAQTEHRRTDSPEMASVSTQTESPSEAIAFTAVGAS